MPAKMVFPVPKLHFLKFSTDSPTKLNKAKLLAALALPLNK